ncbi:MAG: carbamoyl-phosphate synthase (glutamine-hydrolyzing) small subunit [Calditrichaeota bacterium]|nr:MAG: carbamoyl-phosphate synthase (glutamine-hydrolyzing) small subunit [Calditrichota bacterium]
MISNSRLILEDGTVFFGKAFGYQSSIAGEVVFNTGMVGYPETLTDPSYRGQILVMTYPLIGNYGIPKDHHDNGLSNVFESNQIQVSGLIVSDVASKHSHWSAEKSLHEWLMEHRIPGMYGVDTRRLTQYLRSRGSMLGKLVYEEEHVDFIDPNKENLVAQVSRTKAEVYGDGDKTVIIIDCGCKNNIIRSLLKRNLQVKVVPWNWNPQEDENFDGVVISNGPGDPRNCPETVETIRQLFTLEKPIFGICLGNQLMALAAGAQTYKLKFGHRSQNQPCVRVKSHRCFITSQNHGYAVDEKTLPEGWEPWFFNANDGTNEGIRHCSMPFMAVQFHPEAVPGPVDTDFLFDEFVDLL